VDSIQPLSLSDCLDLSHMFIILDSINPLYMWLFRSEPLVHSFELVSSSLSLSMNCWDLNRMFVLLVLVHPLSMRLLRFESLVYYFEFDSTSLSMRLPRSESRVHSFRFDSSSLYIRLFRSEPLASLDLSHVFILLDSIDPLSLWNCLDLN
jgi:hypothetical protein